MLITDPSQLNAARIESTLRNTGALLTGGVESIDMAPNSQHTWSRITHIRVHYREGSSGEQPAQLLLKLCGDNGDVFGPAEVYYYTRDYVNLPNSPVVSCYDACYEASPRRYHLLLKDLFATHTNCDSRDVNESYISALTAAVATLHAYRWGRERLHEIGLNIPTREDFNRYMAHVGQGLGPLLTLLADYLPSMWQRRLQRIFAQLVDVYSQRASIPQGITKLHGDLNPGNILAPLEGDTPIYLIDHQPFDWSLRSWLGASDLVNAIVLYWDSDIRRRFEIPTLRSYHAALLSQGITDYSFTRLMDDYRLCIVEALCAAVEWLVMEEDRDRMQWLWTRQLQRAMAAYEDMNCDEIWC